MKMSRRKKEKSVAKTAEMQKTDFGRSKKLEPFLPSNYAGCKNCISFSGVFILFLRKKKL